MASPEQHLGKSRIVTRTSRRLSARLKSLLNCSMMCGLLFWFSSVTPDSRSQMSVLVAQQDESIDYIQNTAQDIEQDASKGCVPLQTIFSMLTPSPVWNTRTRPSCPLELRAKSGGSVSASSFSCSLLWLLLLPVWWSPTTRSNHLTSSHSRYTEHP